MRVPDWLIYFVVLAVISGVLLSHADKEDAPPAPQVTGPPLDSALPNDPQVLVNVGPVESGVGTAFAIDGDGRFMTARHVVDSCDEVALVVGTRNVLRVERVRNSQDTDLSILETSWQRPPLKMDFSDSRQLQETGFFFGYPQGVPGEAIGELLGRRTMIVRGRYNTREKILAWAEMGRTSGLNGSLGGLSGGPVFDRDGEVIGVVTAESPRRGRIYTVAAESMDEMIDPDPDGRADPINPERYGRAADELRRTRRIAQVYCLVR